MTDREKLTYRLVDAFFKSDVNRCGCPNAAQVADHLIANGVVVREKGEWVLNDNGSATCTKCQRTTKDAWDCDNWLNFCPNCGADMRKVENV